MRNACLFLLVVCFSSLTATAQQRVLTGYIKDSLTLLPVAGGTLSNQVTGKKAQTDASGFFRLPAAPNDLLYAAAPHYAYDTLRYSLLFQDTITIYLSPTNLMEAVTIEGGYARYQQDSLSRRQEFEAARGQKLSTVDKSNVKQTFGLTLNLDKVFKKKYRTQGADERSFTSAEQQAYVFYRFPPQLVTFYTGLKGDALLSFMSRYTPSYQWLREHRAKEQVVDYLSQKLVQYRSSLKAGK